MHSCKIYGNAEDVCLSRPTTVFDLHRTLKGIITTTTTTTTTTTIIIIIIISKCYQVGNAISHDSCDMDMIQLLPLYPFAKATEVNFLIFFIFLTYFPMF
jgi:hypothetical protein